MIPKISWKNVWRNKTRSLVVILSVALGVWAGTFIMAFSRGMVVQYVDMAIKGHISHIQVHNPKFKKEKKVKYLLPGAPELLIKIRTLPEVKGASARTIVNGMASSAVTGSGVTITGIVPENEEKVTGMQKKIIAGAYFYPRGANQVVIGEKLAKKLGVKDKNKIVLTFQDADNNLISGAFHISGIYKTGDAGYEETNLFVKQEDLNRLLAIPRGEAHELAVLLIDNTDKTLAGADEEIKGMSPGLLVETWKEISPELQFIVDTLQQKIYIFIVIILLALAFGIINTMLMAVLERVRELGILMAIGMNKKRVFLMIMIETIYLSLIGGPVGLGLAWLSITWFGKHAINLSAFGKGLSAYGMDTVVYTSLPFDQYINIFILVIATAFLASIYPSIKALQLKPVDAIRKI